jgi:hypothetical protein
MRKTAAKWRSGVYRLNTYTIMLRIRRGKISSMSDVFLEEDFMTCNGKREFCRPFPITLYLLQFQDLQLKWKPFNPRIKISSALCRGWMIHDKELQRFFD